MMNANSGAVDADLSHERRKSLIVEGWRFIPHSYAIVNQWQLLALQPRNISIRVVNAPFYRASWQKQIGLFDPASEQALQSFETAQLDEAADVTLRISFPFNFARSASPLTAVFATLEQQIIQKNQLSTIVGYEALRRSPPPPDIKTITPSLWSAQGFYRAGFDPKQVAVIPHGIDPATFRPMPETRDEMRRKTLASDNEFVFLSVGAMSGNKGIDLILRAFAEICRRFPYARLILKGMDSLYKSRDFLLKAMRTLSVHDQQSVLNRMTYIGDSLSHQAMAALYQIADTYVSPYRAEAFNMPVLEAAACGIPIICTRGGPTDDFVDDTFARRIDSTLKSIAIDGQHALRLEPNLEHLIALMASAIEDNFWRKSAAKAGPAHVSVRYTWQRVADRLVTTLFA